MKTIYLYVLVSFSLFAQDKGQSFYKDKKYEEAIKYYENFLDENSDFSDAKFGIGASVYQLGDNETAISIFNDILSSADSSLKSKAFYNISTLMNEKNKLKESLAYLRKSIELDPHNEDARINYELLKRIIEQNNNQQSKSNDDSRNNEKGDQDVDSEENEKKDKKSRETNSKDDDYGNNGKGDFDNKESVQENDNDNNEKEDQEERESTQPDDNEIDREEHQNNQINGSESGKNSDNKNTNYDKTDKQLQAEAILEALKDNEKINQRRKISGKKSLKLSKDW